MNVGTDTFQALILREFLLEDALSDEFNYIAVASWLGELTAAPAAVAMENFLSENVRRYVAAGMTQQAIVNLVQVKNTSLLMHATADVLAWTQSPADSYESCCRSALCHAVHGSWEWAFGALRSAADKDDTWARHHYIYGLIHGARGAFSRSITELERAAGTEPFPEPQRRIGEALDLARTWAKGNGIWPRETAFNI